MTLGYNELVTIVVLRAGDVAAPVAATRGEFFGLIKAAAGETWRGEWSEHDVRTDAPFPSLTSPKPSAFVMTGSSSSVTERAPWMLRTEAFVREIVRARIPLFGICFGHQLIAQALGGNVTKNPNGREIGSVRVRVTDDDPIFAGAREIIANGTHVDAVTTLPPDARVLATTDLDPCAAFAIGETTRCVQFHPEMDGDVVRGYIRARSQVIRSEGLDPDALHDAVVEAPGGMATLQNFITHFVAKSS